MEYNTYPSHSELKALVKCYWTLEIPKEVPKGRQQVLSDGCMEMIFNLGDDIHRILPNDQYLLQPSSFIVGQINQPMWVEPTGKVASFAVRFHPGAFSYFTSVSMNDLADKDTPLKTLFEEKKVIEIEQKIKNATDTSKRILLLEDFLFSLLKEHINIPDLVASTIDKILQTNGALSIKDTLQSDPGKRRSLERKFTTLVGTSPKQLCKAIRFQKTLKALLNDNKTLTDIGYESEYYDQAHFIKDFKDFTGISPKQFYTDKNFTLSSLLYSKD